MLNKSSCSNTFDKFDYWRATNGWDKTFEWTIVRFWKWSHSKLFYL